MSELINRTITATTLITLFLTAFFYAPSWVLSTAFLLILLIILMFEWPQFKLWWLTPIYPILPMLQIIAINEGPNKWLLLWLLIIVCTHDTGAYFVGKIFGKHKLAPAISPGKTWEGFFGGLIVSIIGSSLVLPLINPIEIDWLLAIFYITILNIAAVAGDLFESYLKRRVGIKDSGNLLPGHGGFLDRLDSLLMVVLVVMIYNLF